MFMRLLGVVEHIVGDKAIVRIADTLVLPPIGAEVYRDNTRIGVLKDIIGPVARPYAVVVYRGEAPGPGDKLYYRRPVRRRSR